MSSAMKMDGQASHSSLAELGITGSASQLLNASGSTQADPSQQSKKLKRSFKACAHCRSRKAKCDLGDLNSPREPPCARCKREGVPCTFLPSKRGGRIPFAARQAKLEAETADQQFPNSATSEYASDGTSTNLSEQYQENYTDPLSLYSGHAQSANIAVSPRFAQLGNPSSAKSTASTSSFDAYTSTALPPMPPTIDAHHSRAPPGSLHQRDVSVSTRPNPFAPTGWNTSILSQNRAIGLKSSQGAAHQPTSAAIMLQGSSAAVVDNSTSRLSQSAAASKKRKAEEPVQPDTLAAAKLHNPVDALNLLVLAADRKGKGRSIDDLGPSAPLSTKSDSTRFENNRDVRAGSHSSESDETPPSPYTLSDFPLAKRKIISQTELIYYINLFFSKIHHIFPVVPYKRIPTNEAELTAFVRDEIHLASVFILLASRNDIGSSRGFDVHNATWAFLQELISDLVFGKTPSVGAVEALLLLSDNPPREVVRNGPPGSAEESRMSWMLVGTAVRLGYMLGLDQTTLVSSIGESDDTPEGLEAREKLDRERIAWTYCYMFDRQMSIRTGKAFWSRGPGLCFTGSSEKSFPSMVPVEGMQDDFASLILAYVEITQIMTNAHDILYPSRDRTISLVKIGEYYKYLDELTRTLNNFRFTWENKKWQTFPLTELVWITFHYLRLYIYAFAFQAHIQRAGIREFAPVIPHTGKPIPATSVFPKGALGSPDAKFILEAIDAAADLIRICTERLHPQGILAFLPWRYFLYLTYAGVFLLKAVYVNAVPSGDKDSTIKLIKRLIVCLACGSKDEHHHSVRYARLLNSLLRSFSRGQDGLGTELATPSGRRSPEGSPQPQAMSGQAPKFSQTANVHPTMGTLGTSASSFNPTLAFATDSPGTINQQPPLFSTSATPDNPTSDFFSSNVPTSFSSNQYLTDGLATNIAQEEQTAASLLTDDFNLDFIFTGMEPSSQTFDYSNFMDDTTWDYWASLSGNPA